jgi:putative tricarboxylic transport membrane protein
MKMERGNIVIIVVLEGLGIWVIIDSYRLGLQTIENPGAGLFPFLQGVLLCLVGLQILISSLKSSSDIDTVKKERGIEPKANLKRVGAATACLVGYALLLEKLGYAITTFLFLFGLLWIGYHRRWLFVFEVSIVVTILSYLLFDVFLKVPFPGFF